MENMEGIEEWELNPPISSFMKGGIRGIENI